MRRLVMFIAALSILCSCSKDDVIENVEPGMESVLYLSLAPDSKSWGGGSGTKAVGDGHGSQAYDNNIQTLEVFVFRINEGKPDDGVLDGYRKFTGADLGNLTNLEVQTTTGKKMIYAVANSHRVNWKGINTRALFEEQTASLKDEDVKNFIMIGGTEAQLQLASTVSFTIRRLVARIKVNSIKTAFAGGPYEGMPLTDLKAYLINVQASKFIYNGAGDNFLVLNNGKYVDDDSKGCVMDGLIADAVASPIYDDGYSVPHYFYCYENALESETGGNKFTRIVLEGKLNGTTYYYPIPIKGISRNSCYSIDVTIKRPGSLDPNKDVEKGTLLATMTVLDWDVIDNNNVEF